MTEGPITPEDYLAHYGVPGMKWGRRRTEAQLATARVASADALKVAQIKKKGREGGVNALSNIEIRELKARQDLERDFNAWREANPTRKEKAVSFVKTAVTNEFKKGLGIDPKNDVDFMTIVNKLAKAKALSLGPPPDPNRQPRVNRNPDFDRDRQRRRREDPVFNVTSL